MKTLTGTKSDLQLYYQSTTARFIPEVAQITSPLNKIGVSYFSYIEHDLFNKKSMGLVNQNNCPEYFFANQGMKMEPFPPPQDGKNFFYRNSEITKTNKKAECYYAEVLKINKVTDFCVYVVVENSLIKTYGFGLTPAYVSHFELLEAFASYFNDKAKHLIKQSDWAYHPASFSNNFKPDVCTSKVDNDYDTRAHEFLNDINYQHYRLHKFVLKYGLSKREMECIDLVLQNKISKEIAYILGLSVRTIEAYLENIKRKTHCRNKTELITRLLGL
jgi:DNA-binding CsgD family transcriptional regulator